MPKKICSSIGCSQLIDVKQRYCTSHASERLKEKQKNNSRYNAHRRDKESTKFYKSSQWLKLREVVMNECGGLCKECNELDMIVKADVVDHIIPIAKDWSLRLNRKNLQPLCHFHHNNKTAKDKLKYRG